MRAFRHARHGRATGDGGFTLIEVIVSLVLLSLIMSAVTTLFIRSQKSSVGLQDRQAAVPVATQAMDIARTIPAARDSAGNSSLVGGRTQAAVTAQWASVAGLPGVDLSDTYATWDTTATAGSTPVLPLATTVLISGKAYDVKSLVGVCYRADVDSDCLKLSGQATPPATTPAGQVLLYRVIIVVSFKTPDGGCASGCTYVTSTLIDPSADPTFNTNDASIPPPVAVGDSVTIDAASPGAVLGINVLSNDSGTFTTYPVVIAIPPGKGSVTVGGTGVVTYTANSGASGTDYFTYYLRDVAGTKSAAATVSITINPRAGADGFTTGQGKSVTYNLKGNDVGTFPTTGTTCITITSPPAHGAVSLGTCGSVTYTPSGSYSGTDSFRYVITDTSALDSNEVTATVTVYPPPTAVNDSVVVNSGTTTGIAVQGNDVTPAGSATTSIVSGPANGSASVSGANINYTAPSTFSGTTSFTYKLTDVYGNSSSTATVTVVVKPTATNLPSSGTGVGKSVGTTVSGYVKGSFSGTYVSAVSSAGGTVTASGGNLTYTPKPGYSGSDTITYTVTDTSGQKASATWVVTVAAAPNAANDSVSMPGGSTGSINVTANDSVPGGVASVAVISGPTSGSATVSGINVNYTPAAGFSGTATFTYRVTDTYGNSDTATVTVNVTKPAAPSGSPDSVTVQRNKTINIDVLANDSYPGGVSTITIVTPPGSGTATVQGSGTGAYIQFKAANNGTDRWLEYTITDTYGQTSAPIRVTLVVT